MQDFVKYMFNNYNEYKKHLKPLFTFMCKKERMKVPYPKVVFHTKIQDCKDSLHSKTGYFDPNTNKIHMFLCDNKGERIVKDVLRSFAHEVIHYFQEHRGDIEKSGYSGDKITEDNKLIGLEKEAYLKGNLLFRSYTELLK